MSAMNSLALNRIDGTQAESIKDTVDAIQVTPDSELPPSVATSTACLSSQQGKVPLRLASCSNSCGVPPQASVKQQQPQTSKKQRISSTSSVCTTSSKKSCKSTASQIQEVAGDEVCAAILLASFAIFLISCLFFLGPTLSALSVCLSLKAPGAVF
ncbi:uncharacterized protein LOC117675449 isoform X2 [Pantherophis guttatus]|uniref:Uncharacterized protein LOC117675449 isoform X2 n=1 Tax=Pantherophis guttatus TaxID=94885 RepID=A0ABM3YTC8_PANGU|nr:uncharacterized protein LOC117675449 isoform X2 [Pantherophis guttatus]